MKVKGGHSWPPILCEEYSEVLCGHFCPSLRIAEVRELALPQHLMKNKCSQIIHPLNKDCQALILAIRLLGTVR